MKRFAGLFLSAFIILAAAPSWAQQPYLSGNIGFSFHTDGDISGSVNEFDHDPGLAVNGALGVGLGPMFRVEGEIAWHVNGADVSTVPQDFTFSVVTFMGNGYLDFPTNSPLRPYVGAGVGFGVVNVQEDFSGFTASDSDAVAAFQFMTGVGYDISPRATFTFGYRYLTTSDPSFQLPVSGAFETEYNSHDFLFGARFRF